MAIWSSQTMVITPTRVQNCCQFVSHMVVPLYKLTSLFLCSWLQEHQMCEPIRAKSLHSSHSCNWNFEELKCSTTTVLDCLHLSVLYYLFDINLCSFCNCWKSHCSVMRMSVEHKLWKSVCVHGGHHNFKSLVKDPEFSVRAKSTNLKSQIEKPEMHNAFSHQKYYSQ